MPKIHGKKEALKLLTALDPSESKNLIEKMRLQDPKMAEFLEGHLVSIEDLQFLTPSQMLAFLRDIKLEEFGLALRGVDQNIVESILSSVSTGIRLDIEDGLKGPPRKLAEVSQAQNNILKTLNDKIQSGQIIIDREEKTV